MIAPLRHQCCHCVRLFLFGPVIFAPFLRLGLASLINHLLWRSAMRKWKNKNDCSFMCLAACLYLQQQHNHTTIATNTSSTHALAKPSEGLFTSLRARANEQWAIIWVHVLLRPKHMNQQSSQSGLEIQPGYAIVAAMSQSETQPIRTRKSTRLCNSCSHIRNPAAANQD